MIIRLVTNILIMFLNMCAYFRKISSTLETSVWTRAHHRLNVLSGKKIHEGHGFGSIQDRIGNIGYQ